MAPASPSVDRPPTYSELHPVPIETTILKLKQRIEARFPNSSLSRLAAELVQVAKANEEVLRQLRRPIWWLRVLIALAVAAVAALIVWAIARLPSAEASLGGVTDVVQ